MVTERVCDRCRARRENSEGWLKLYLGHAQLTLLGWGRVVDEDLGDLCPACLVSLRAWRASAEEAPVTDAPPVPVAAAPAPGAPPQPGLSTMNLLES